MVTVTDRETERSQGTGGRYCEGCPRCQNSDAGFCAQRHPQHNNLHPVCRKCGHCVLRGSHSDDTSDLESPRMLPVSTIFYPPEMAHPGVSFSGKSRHRWGRFS